MLASPMCAVAGSSLVAQPEETPMPFTHIARLIIVESLRRGYITANDKAALQAGFMQLPTGLAILAAGCFIMAVRG